MVVAHAHAGGAEIRPLTLLLRGRADRDERQDDGYIGNPSRWSGATKARAGLVAGLLTPDLDRREFWRKPKMRLANEGNCANFEASVS